MLTNKGKYGLKAMVHLAGLEPDVLAQAADIADTNSISKKFLDHILTELRRAGFVYAKKGKGGGYALARPAHEIRVGAIVRALDGPLAPISLRFGHGFSPVRRLPRSENLRGTADHDRSSQRHRQRARQSLARRDADADQSRRAGRNVPHLTWSRALAQTPVIEANPHRVACQNGVCEKRFRTLITHVQIRVEFVMGDR